MNVQELFIKANKHIENVYKSPHTRSAYSRGLQVFQTYLDLPDSEPASRITPSHFVGFPEHLSSLNYAKRTVSVMVSAMNILMSYMERNDLIEFSRKDMLRLKEALKDIQRSKEQPLPKVPKNGDVAKTIQAVSTRRTWGIQKLRDQALVLVLRSSGLRVSEIANLKISDIDFSTDMPTVKVKHGKGNKERYTFINEEATRSLEEYWEARGWAEPDDPVFARHDKRHGKLEVAEHSPIQAGGIRAIIDRLAAEAGVDVHPHSFRHEFVTTIVKETGNISLAKDLAGHSSINTTQIYTHIPDDSKREAYVKVFNK